MHLQQPGAWKDLWWAELLLRLELVCKQSQQKEVKISYVSDHLKENMVKCYCGMPKSSAKSSCSQSARPQTTWIASVLHVLVIQLKMSCSARAALLRCVSKPHAILRQHRLTVAPEFTAVIVSCNPSQTRVFNKLLQTESRMIKEWFDFLKTVHLWEKQEETAWVALSKVC